MKFCPSCGQGYVDEATYCQNCGTNLEAEGAPGPSPPYQPPPAPGMQPGYPYQRRQTEGNAIASLVLGISAFVICPLIPAILAIIFGNSAIKNIQESGGALEGEGMARAGIILGWVNIGLTILGAIIWGIIAIIAATQAATVLMPLMLPA